MSSEELRVVEAYVRAMELGRHGVDALVALFDDEAVYIEPFSGSGHEHRGAKEIRDYFEASVGVAVPDPRLELIQVDVAGSIVDARWRCHSPVFTTPAVGHDRYTIVNGRISRLETTIIEPPRMDLD